MCKGTFFFVDLLIWLFAFWGFVNKKGGRVSAANNF